MDTETVLYNLKVCSMIGEHCKLSTGPRFALRTPTTLRSLSRWWYGEGRERDLETLRGLLSAAVNLVHVCLVEEARGGRGLSSRRIVEAVYEAERGIRVLLRTYHECSETCAKLELMLQEMRDRLDVILRDSAPRAPDTLEPCESPRHTLDTERSELE